MLFLEVVNHLKSMMSDGQLCRFMAWPDTIPYVFTENKLETEGFKGHAFAMAMLFGLDLGYWCERNEL